MIYVYDSCGTTTSVSLMCCSVDLVCCRVLQSVAECCRVLQSGAVCCSVLQSVAVCCRVLQQYMHMTHGASTESFWGHSTSRVAGPSDILAELIAKDANACVNFVLAAGPTSESISAIMRQFGAKCVCKEITGSPRMEDLQDVKKNIEADARGCASNEDTKCNTVCV